MSYASVWWSVDLPPDWQGYSDGPCSTFESKSNKGTLQISAARKEGESVMDEDLRSFALERIPADVPLHPTQCGSFSGLTASYQKEGRSWREWWLKSDRLMVYATYNSGLDDSSTQEQVLRILGSLKART